MISGAMRSKATSDFTRDLGQKCRLQPSTDSNFQQGVQVMRRNAVGAVALLLCTLVVGAILFRERCRLGDVRWRVCNLMGIPHAGGPFTAPPN